MMSASDSSIVTLLKAVLQAMIGQSPMLLAYAAALILVIVRWRQAPRASMMALCGVLFGLFLLVVIPLVYAWVPHRFNSSGSSLMEMQSIYTVISFVASAAHAISFGFLFTAIYIGRRTPGAPAGY